MWFKNGKFYLSSTSSLIQKIIADCHLSPTGGYFRFHKTLSCIKHSFYWINIHRSVNEVLQQCDICQQYKIDCMKPVGLLQPLPIPNRMWTDISMDFIEELSLSNGHTVIVVVVDCLTKYAYFILLKHPFTTATVAKLFVANMVCFHGIPTSIVSDREKVFLSSFWQSIISVTWN